MQKVLLSTLLITLTVSCKRRPESSLEGFGNLSKYKVSQLAYTDPKMTATVYLNCRTPDKTALCDTLPGQIRGQTLMFDGFFGKPPLDFDRIHFIRTSVGGKLFSQITLKGCFEDGETKTVCKSGMTEVAYHESCIDDTLCLPFRKQAVEESISVIAETKACTQPDAACSEVAALIAQPETIQNESAEEVKFVLEVLEDINVATGLSATLPPQADFRYNEQDVYGRPSTKHLQGTGLVASRLDLSKKLEFMKMRVPPKREVAHQEVSAGIQSMQNLLKDKLIFKTQQQQTGRLDTSRIKALEDSLMASGVISEPKKQEIIEAWEVQRELNTHSVSPIEGTKIPPAPPLPQELTRPTPNRIALLSAISQGVTLKKPTINAPTPLSARDEMLEASRRGHLRILQKPVVTQAEASEIKERDQDLTRAQLFQEIVNFPLRRQR